MNKLYALMFGFVMATSGSCMAAELTDKQKQLKESLVAALFVNIVLEQRVVTTPYFNRKDLKDALEQYSAEIIALEKQGITLPERDIDEAYTFGEKFERECEQLTMSVRKKN